MRNLIWRKKGRFLICIIIKFLKEIHGLHTVYTRFGHGLYTVYTRFIHGLYTVYTRFIHGLYTVYTRFIHGLYTVYTWFIHGLYTVYTRFIHGLYMVYNIWFIAHGKFVWIWVSHAPCLDWGDLGSPGIHTGEFQGR